MASILDQGNYEVFMDAGYLVNAFRLDSSQLNGTDVLNGTTEFFDVTAYVQSVSISRGRQKFRQPIDAGRCTIQIDDTNGDFSVVNSDSPYWDPEDDRLGFQPTRRVKVLRNSEELFVGQIVTYDQELTLDNQSIVTVSCTDELKGLQQVIMDAFTPTQQYSGARVAYVLDRPEVDLFTGVGQRNISTGQALLGTQAFEGGQSVANYFERVQLAEQGRIFISRDGVFTTQDRIGRTNQTATAEFSDVQDGDIPFAKFKVVYE